jgi:hypothetical protein
MLISRISESDQAGGIPRITLNRTWYVGEEDHLLVPPNVDLFLLQDLVEAGSTFEFGEEQEKETEMERHMAIEKELESKAHEMVREKMKEAQEKFADVLPPTSDED